MKLLYLQTKSHLGHLCFKASSNWGKIYLLSISYLLRNIGLTYCCTWSLQECTVELSERWQMIRHRLGSQWLCWLLNLCFTCSWGAKEIVETENERTDGWPGPALPRKWGKPGRRTLHKQHSSSFRGASIGPIGVWISAVLGSRVWTIPVSEMENAAVSLQRKAQFPLSKLQPIPSGHQGYGRRLTGFPAWGHEEAVWEEAISQVWGWTHTDAGHSFNPLPCFFCQLQCWLYQDSHSLRSGPDTNLTEQWLDRHIFMQNTVLA